MCYENYVNSNEIKKIPEQQLRSLEYDESRPTRSSLCSHENQAPWSFDGFAADHVLPQANAP